MIHIMNVDECVIKFKSRTHRYQQITQDIFFIYKEAFFKLNKEM